VGEMLAAGLLPGLLISLLLVIMNSWFAVRNQWVKTSRLSVKKIARTSLSGLPALLAPVIILGGIFMGTFTPTEASAIAFVYCLLIGAFFYRELNGKRLYKIVYEGGRTTGIVAMELGSGLLFSNLITVEGIPEILTRDITNLTHSPLVIMLLINIILFVAGMFLNPGFSIIVFTPLLLPLAKSIGFSELHFGVIMITNLALGLITPPVGACLYIGSVVSGIRIEKMIKDLLPFYLVLFLALILIIIFPALSQGFVDMVYR
jgi:C4-dicarboxylate transporter DctM subunit